MIVIGYFFIMLIGPFQVAMGPYADYAYCESQAVMMSEAQQVVSVCYGAMLPPAESTPELERDATS